MLERLSERRGKGWSGVISARADRPTDLLAFQVKIYSSRLEGSLRGSQPVRLKPRSPGNSNWLNHETVDRYDWLRAWVDTVGFTVAFYRTTKFVTQKRSDWWWCAGANGLCVVTDVGEAALLAISDIRIGHSEEKCPLYKLMYYSRTQKATW